MTEEKRIYVVVSETVDTPKGVITQPAGRLAAQACHATSRMRMARMQQKLSKIKTDKEIKEHELVKESITTIVLGARDSKELGHIEFLLNKAGLEYEAFTDTNEEAYGKASVFTALATYPIAKSEVEGILDYLPLWAPKK